MAEPSSKEPKWLRNYWRIFDGIRKRGDFQTDSMALRESRLADSENALPLIADRGFQLLVAKHEIPPTCIGAAEYLVNHPSADDETLKAKITSPITWINPSTRQLGPEQEGYMDYDMWQHLRDGYFGLSFLLEIRPYTKLSEIKDFLDEYKDEIDVILKNPPAEAKYSYSSSLSKRVDKPDKIGESGLMLREQGHTVKEAMHLLDVDDKMDEANFRAYVSRAKKRRDARNKNY